MAGLATYLYMLNKDMVKGQKKDGYYMAWHGVSWHGETALQPIVGHLPGVHISFRFK
jgi:hypothetical protein